MPATARYPRVRTEGGMRDNTILVVPYSAIGNAQRETPRACSSALNALAQAAGEATPSLDTAARLGW